MIKDLADRIDKPPEEIMLVYQGQPIVATRLSWRSVLVDPTAGLGEGFLNLRFEVG
jgi:hypothetical protein